MTCNTSAVAVCCANASSRSARGLVELLLKFSDGPPKIGYFVVEHLRHLLIPSGRGLNTTRLQFTVACG